MASGVFAGDATRLSLKSCFPRIHEVEAEYGSLIRGLIKLQRKSRREGAGKAPGPGPGGTLTSFEGGMSEMTDRVAEVLGSRVRTDATVAGISPREQGWVLHLADGSDLETEHAVLAVPAYTQARILRSLDSGLADLLEGIEYPSLAVICLGYDRQQIDRGPEGFGFLVPSREQRLLLGTVVDSNVFPGRAPEGRALLRCMVGGARSSRLAHLPEQQLIERVLKDLEDMTGLSSDPEFVKIYRHDKAIPQYQVGHQARLDAVDEIVAAYPGLHLTGNAFRGVSLNDCVVNAGKVAQDLVPAREAEQTA
jgi:oxygen-dependent protoporphyrinogen oxidase